MPEGTPSPEDRRAASRADVEAAREGDAHAFERLVLVWAPRVTALARAIVGSADAEDVAQETLLRAWRSLPSLADPGRFDAWLMSITRNLARNRLRDRRLRERREREPAALEATETPADPSDEHAGEHTEVRSAVAGLPQKQREVVRLRYEAGMSYTEIAAALGISPQRVKSRLHDAKVLLRKRLQ